MTTPSKRQISENRRLLQNPYAFLDEEGNFSAALDIEASAEQISANRLLLKNQYAFDDGTSHLSAKLPSGSSNRSYGSEKIQSPKPNGLGYRGIEQAARNLQKTIWRRRRELWPDGVPNDPVELLEPSIALGFIGFEFNMVDTLGQYSNGGTILEVAGIIERPEKRVRISRQLPFNTQHFTAAHELGHAVLHDNIRMHRDRPLDGSGLGHVAREKIEKEADKFASLFLMPKNLLRTRFQQYFLCDKFSLNEQTIFALDPAESMMLHECKKTVRELARILASADSYNGQYFRSLAEQFNVSVEAMAIRLEELGLLEV